MKEYTNGEITIYWYPERCIHSGNCVKGLPRVFDRDRRPWIKMQNASSKEIMKTVDRCPSGALSCKRNKVDQMPASKINVSKNGPLLVEGGCELIDEGGEKIASNGPFALCRCGGSKRKPFCDGTHITIGFDGSS
jgi:uncharacterized Fe-S cluster protein YjdI